MGILKWALIFAVAALVAAVFGFGGMAEGFADIAQFLFVAFVVVAVIIGVLGLRAIKRVT
ncbi:DUF1328 family protein [Chondromyces crocatus]|uniref:Membrane protein n=1 Tax=Chondromyces crocatus TaxID=52 RepID=A0A0K1ES92_CHOCO|nr:DUF1328 family protein [Chondromyces crocatus]AKT43800.1 membrane protein [Chondromyces crocatus]